MADKKDIISYEDYQKLSEEEKKNFKTKWDSDVNSEVTKQKVKLPDLRTIATAAEIKPPVTGTKQAGPSTAQNKLTLNDKLDKKDTEAKGKTETADKANRMRDSLKAKTGTTATDKSINQFQIGEKSDFDEQNKVKFEGLKQQEKQPTEIRKEKEAADKGVEDARILLDRVKQSAARNAEKLGDYGYSKDDSFTEKVTKLGKSIKGSFLAADVKETRKDLERLAKDLNVDLGDVAKSVGIEDISKELHLTKLAEVHGKLYDIAKARLAAAKTKQQEVQTNYTKAEEAAKRKAEEEAKRKESESAPKEQKVQDEVLTEKEEALEKVLDRAKIRRGELDEEWDKLLEDNEKELDKHREAADLADFLPRFAIQHYLEGNFGERKTAKALGTLGYFLLDKIGVSLVNASQVARGLSPTQKTALEQYNTKMMEAAINRDDKNRSKINEEKVNTIIKNSDALRTAGYDTEVKFTNDMASKYLEQHADQIDELAYMKLKKQAADWYDNLTDAEKMEVDRLFLAMSTNPDDRMRGILQYQLSGFEVLGQSDEAKKQQAKYVQAEAKAKTKTIDKLTRAQAARAEQEIENMKKDGKLTEAQAADAWKQVEIHQKDLDWRDAQEWQKQVTGYVESATGAVGNLFKIFK